MLSSTMIFNCLHANIEALLKLEEKHKYLEVVEINLIQE